MFFINVWFMCLIAYVVASANVGTQIFDGKDAAIADHRYQVSVQYLGHHVCGGVIIAKRYVLTAAHCLNVDLFRTIYYSVLAGVDNLDNADLGQRYVVLGIHQHSLYKDDSLDFDVAILETKGVFIFGPKVGKVLFPSENDYPEPPEGTDVVITGWGISKSGWGSRILQKFTSTVINRKKCNSLYKDTITPSMICIGQGACQGDAGGPAVTMDGYIVGMFSWTYGCRQGYYGVYVHIGMIRSYIRFVTSE